MRIEGVDFSRRDFMKGLGATAVVGLAGLNEACKGCEDLLDQIRKRPTRRDISKLPANHPIIDSYKAAVSAMKALPSSDGRNWTKQAQIHNNFCPHGNWYFLPWHRAYLLFFEQICRELSGNKHFALPYWNWSANPSIPGVFWGGTSNPLFNGTRTATAASVADSSMVGATVLESILNEPNFLVFASGQVSGQRTPDTYGRLESRPHNYIHGFVGGDMSTYMSPLDPIFWTHHNMIECCWVEWNLNRNHPNTNATQWTSFAFNGNFVDRNGAPVNVQVSETLLYPLLAYQYEPCQPGGKKAGKEQPATRAEAEALQRFLREGAAVSLEFSRHFELQRSLIVPVGKPAAAPIKVDPEQFRTALESNDRLLLILNEVQQPPHADFFVRVFLNKRDASPQTPREDPHYAGSFAFFSDEGHPDMQKASFLIDVADTLRGLGRAGALGAAGELEIQLVPVPFEGREAQGQRFTLGRIEIGVSPASK